MSEETIMSRFERAKNLSELACFLDELHKTEYTPDELASVALCVNTLHGLAMKMAGERLSEIYSNDAEDEVLYLRHIGKAARRS
jgi:hypothetical protein